MSNAPLIFVNLLEAAEQKGDQKAQYVVGLCYEEGMLGQEKDEAKARQCFLKAAEGVTGYKLAQDKIGKLQPPLTDSEILKYGGKEDQYGRGLSYEAWEGLPDRYQKALSFYIPSAEKGYKEAALRLITFYTKGMGCKKDEKKAFKWKIEVGSLGDKNIQYEVGRAYWYGVGVKKDKKEAVKWLLKAAAKFCTPARGLLAEAYYYGIGCERDHDQAYDFALRSSEQGDRRGEYILGHHAILNKNYTFGVKRIAYAAQSGHPAAQLFIQNLFKK